MPTRRSKIKGIDRYLSPKKSRCRNEKKHGDYAVYTDASLDIKLLIALMRNKDGAHLRDLAYVPNWILYAQDEKKPRSSPARAGLIISHMDSISPVFTAPHILRSEIVRCRRLKKRFIIANLGIYMQEYDSQDGHSNSIIIDVSRGVVERFEPHGRNDTDMEDLKIEKLFKAKLPDFEYFGTRKTSPKKGVQSIADPCDGMCATYVALFSLLRVMNPDESSARIQEYMARGSKAQLTERVLRFHRYIADTLRGERPHSTLSHSQR